MLSNFFNIDGSVMRTLTKIADIAVVNILWLVCSIPIVTIGPSTTAMFYVLLKMKKNEESHIVKMFFKEFKADFLKKFIAGIIVLLAGGFLYMDIKIITNFLNASDFSYMTAAAIIIFTGILVIIYLIIATLIFPLMAQFDNTVKQSFINSLFIGLRFVYLVIPAAVIETIPVILFLYKTDLFIKTFILWIILGFAGLAYINTYLFGICFKPYMPEDEKKDEEADVLDVK